MTYDRCCRCRTEAPVLTVFRSVSHGTGGSKQRLLISRLMSGLEFALDVNRTCVASSSVIETEDSRTRLGIMRQELLGGRSLFVCTCTPSLTAVKSAKKIIISEEKSFSGLEVAASLLFQKQSNLHTTPRKLPEIANNQFRP